GGVLAADGHQAGHLVLGDVDLLAAPVGQGDVGDLVVALCREGLGHSVHAEAPVSVPAPARKGRVGNRAPFGCDPPSLAVLVPRSQRPSAETRIISPAAHRRTAGAVPAPNDGPVKPGRRPAERQPRVAPGSGRAVLSLVWSHSPE